MDAVITVLIEASDKKLAQAIINAYKEVEENFAFQNWKLSELDAGHFVESVRRFIELKLFGEYTPFGSKLPDFQDAVLKKYENCTGDESYRMLIPRVLKSIANIRNKRGVGHIGLISPNEMDATLILYNVKWVLAELIRLNSNFSTDLSQKLISTTVERQVEAIWSEGEIVRVLNPKISAREQVLLLLLKNSPQVDVVLREVIEYSNSTNFKKILKRLHTNRLIEYLKDGGCLLTPIGRIEAEKLLLKLFKV